MNGSTVESREAKTRDVGFAADRFSAAGSDLSIRLLSYF